MIQRYKYLILPVFLCLWTSISWAQEPKTTWVLNADESSASKNYVARESVALQSNGTTGFHFKAEGGKSFSAKIDAGLLFPPVDKTYANPDGSITTDSTMGAIVSKIPGQFGVTPTGSSTYTIPIECPAGINGMQPSVSIIYNSQLTIGLLGRGFNLACSSTISRVPHSLYYDNDTHSVTFDGKDRFALDGMRLICDNIAEYGANGTVYFTENNQTSRIKSVGITGDGPQYFTVETPDGKLMEYGTTADSRLIPSSETGVYIWYLKKVTDNNGNSIEYIYTKFNTETVLSSIEYAGGSINFSYTTCPVKNNYYTNGNEIKNGAFLDRIRVKGLNDYIRNYGFTKISQNGQVLLTEVKEYYNKSGKDLTEIERGNDNKLVEGYSYKNPIKFNWANTVSSTFNNNLLSGIPLAVVPAFLDFNGDGYDDLFVVNKTGTDEYGYNMYTQKIYQNNGNGKKEVYSEEVKDKNENFGSHEALNSRINTFADINGDGKSDLIYKTKYLVGGSDPGSLDFYHCIRVRQLDNIEAEIAIYHMHYNNNNVYLNNRTSDENREFKTVIADFDGDGSTKILVIQDDNVCKIIKDDKHASPNDTLKITNINCNGIDLYKLLDIQIGDFDGDGKMDFGGNINNQFKTFKIVNNTLSEIYTFNTTIKFVADINQDGTSDLISFGASNGEYDDVLQGNISTLTYTIYFREKNNTFKSESGELLKGNTFSDYIHKNFPAFSGETSFLSSAENIQVNDVRFEDTDGDGILNIVLMYDRTYNFTSTYEDDGSTIFNQDQKTIISNFFEKPEIFTQPGVCTQNSYWRNASGYIAIGSYYGNKLFIDPQYLNPEYDRTYMDKEDISSNSQYKQLLIGNFHGNGIKSLYVSGTRRTAQGSDVYSYIEKSNNNSNRYSIHSIEDAFENRTTINYKIQEEAGTTQTFPYFNYKTGNPIVNTVNESNAKLNFSRTSSYSFTNDVFHRFKGFLGYLNFSVTDPDGITESATGELNTNFGVIVPKLENSIKKNTTTDVTIIDKLNKRYWIRPDKVTIIDNLNAGTNNSLTTIKTYENYDSNGNPTCIKTEYGNGTGVVSTENYKYVQKGSWYANKPETYSVVNTGFNVPSQTKTTEYTYYENGNLKSEITDKTDDRKLTKDYVYDSYGNPTQVSVTAKNLTTGAPVVRTTTMTYPTGRFIETKTNPLGQITTYHWKAENGLLTSEDIKLSSDSPLRTTSYCYDIWGQLVETIYPDGIRKTQVLQWADPNNTIKAKYNVYSQTSGTTPIQIWYDALGREVSKESYGLNGRKVSVFTEYNPDGRIKQVSEPTFNSSAETWAQYDFDYNTDPFKRVTSVKTPTGTVTNTYGKTSTVTLTVDTPDGPKTTKQETTLNDAGMKISSKIDEKEVTFTYCASGLPKTSTPVGGQAIIMDYDILGNRIYLNDPDAGIVESKYNGFGELVEEKQKVHNNTTDIITSNTYKPNGLLDYIGRNGETTSYTYDPENHVSKIEISSTNKKELSYDGFGRVTNVKETIGTHEYNRQTEYDFYGRIKKDIYPTGYYILNKYDEYGNLTEVTDKNNRTLWKAIEKNARGQLTNISKGGKVTTYGFDAVTGLPTSTFANGVINYSYVFNNLGNLIERNDNNTAQKEKFVYNNQNQLTDWYVYRNITTLAKHNYITYNATTSNITAKSDLGPFTLDYGGKRPDESAIGPHALATISGVPTNFPLLELPNYPTAELNVTYTDFKKIATLKEKNKDYYLTYGVDEQRRMSVYKVGGVTQLTRYYVGDYEEEITPNGRVRKIHYLDGAILIQNEGQADSLLYAYTDYQGSLIALTDESGKILTKNINGEIIETGRFAYDPWGARRNPDDWTQMDSRTNWIINRGYTGHEHLDAFSIINMNGRVYDPLTAMFFSPDPALDGSNWLSYNRYSYCLGNPFKYTDPSGNSPLIAAAFIGGFINLSMQMLSGNINSVGDFFKAFGVGAVSGLTGAWIGGVVSTSIGLNLGIGGACGATVGAAGGAASGLIGGAGNAWINGASFGDGLLAGLNGAIVGGWMGGVIGGVTQGISVTKHGGDFWTGNNYTSEMSVGANANETTAPAPSSTEIEANDKTLINRTKAEYNTNEDLALINKTKMTTANSTGYSYSNNGNFINAKGETIPGYTVVHAPEGNLTATNCEIHIGSYATNERISYFKAVVGHELIHAYHFYHGISRVFSEKVAYHYSFRVSMMSGYLEVANGYRFFATAIQQGYWWGNVTNNLIPSHYSFAF